MEDENIKELETARRIQRLSVVDWEHEFTRSIVMLFQNKKELSFKQKIVWEKLKKKYS
ncbi:hypothetical protein KY328_05175 [Candidatus Woesearchaeota archaeon]|nr:hypothetical protein [Candidatus Woesearchaeota archaeon]MBW3022290.1 hypothetical protein [Candidatus Woesearchaeota archaeon]